MDIRIVRNATIITALCAGTLAHAATDGFDTCAQEKDAARRLACFDQQVAARRLAVAAEKTPSSATQPAQVAAPTPAASSGSTAPAAATKAPVPVDVGLDSRELRRQRQERGEDPHPEASIVINAKVVRVIDRRPMISAFELDNGQIWEQVETVSGLWIRPNESVTIRAGAIGGFLLKSADGHIVRVHREK